MKKSFLPVLVISLLLFPFISSAGVATSYWDEKPLKLAPGESATVAVRLQSEGEEINLRASLDSDIAELVDGSDYFVSKGESVPVNIRVSVPEDADIGTKYSISISFQQISQDTGGMLQVAQGITSKLPVEVVGEKESELSSLKPKTDYTLIAVLLVALAIVAFLAYRFLKGKTKTGRR